MPPYYQKSKSDKWMVPTHIYSELDDEFHFTGPDPCPIDWEKETHEDGLTSEWGQCVFVNPPYSKCGEWVEKSWKEWKKGKTIVMLINSCTDTSYFHKWIYGQAELRFIRGRLAFINPKEPDRKTYNVRPSMVVVFR